MTRYCGRYSLEYGHNSCQPALIRRRMFQIQISPLLCLERFYPYTVLNISPDKDLVFLNGTRMGLSSALCELINLLPH